MDRRNQKGFHHQLRESLLTVYPRPVDTTKDDVVNKEDNYRPYCGESDTSECEDDYYDSQELEEVARYYDQLGAAENAQSKGQNEEKQVCNENYYANSTSKRKESPSATPSAGKRARVHRIKEGDGVYRATEKDKENTQAYSYTILSSQEEERDGEPPILLTPHTHFGALKKTIVRYFTREVINTIDPSGLGHEEKVEMWKRGYIHVQVFSSKAVVEAVVKKLKDYYAISNPENLAFSLYTKSTSKKPSPNESVVDWVGGVCVELLF